MIDRLHCQAIRNGGCAVAHSKFRRQTHFLHNGLVARIVVNKIEVRKVLNVHQTEITLRVGLFQITECFLFAF